MKFRTIFFVSILALPALQACSAETGSQLPSKSQGLNKNEDSKGSSKVNNNCLIPDDAFDGLPIQVLMSTDVVEFHTFSDSASMIGRFSAKTGGAIMSVNFYQNQQDYAVNRIYREPGIPVQEKVYSPLCLKDGLIFGEFIRAKFVGEGLLWLELNAGNDFIAPDLWFLLTKSN